MRTRNQAWARSDGPRRSARPLHTVILSRTRSGVSIPALPRFSGARAWQSASATSPDGARITGSDHRNFRPGQPRSSMEYPEANRGNPGNPGTGNPGTGNPAQPGTTRGNPAQPGTTGNPAQPGTTRDNPATRRNPGQPGHEGVRGRHKGVSGEPEGAGTRGEETRPGLLSPSGSTSRSQHKTEKRGGSMNASVRSRARAAKFLRNAVNSRRGPS